MITEKQQKFQEKVDYIKEWVKNLDQYKLYPEGTIQAITDKQYQEGLINFMLQLDAIAEEFGLEEEHEPTMYEKLIDINVRIEECRQIIESLIKPKPKVFDLIFNESMTAYDEMVQSAEELYDRSVHKAIEECENAK